MMTIRALEMSKIGSRTARSDCVARAITFLTKGDYSEVVDFIQLHQMSFNPEGHRQGVNTKKLLGQEKKIYGHTFKVINLYPGCTVGGFRRNYPKGKYLVRIKRHAFAIQDGEVWDACDTPDRIPLQGAWEVVK